MINYLFPNNIKCLICSEEVYEGCKFGLCQECYEKIVFTSDYSCCILCGRPIKNFGEYRRCIECQKHDRNFERGYSCCVYEGISEKIIIDFKYNDKSYLYKLLSEIMIDKILKEEIKFDYIIYTPIHFTRNLVRGFNQTKLIAKDIGDSLGKEVVDNLLIRKKMTRRLKKLSRDEREEELNSAFELNKSMSVLGDDILLIDDIFTTGTTLSTCSEILLENGASSIQIITFAVKCNYDYNVYK